MAISVMTTNSIFFLSTVVDSDVGQQKSMQKDIQPEQFPDSENDNDDGLLGKLVNCTGGNGDRRDFKILGSQHWFQCDGQRRFPRTFVRWQPWESSTLPRCHYRPVQERAWTSLGPRRPTWLTAGPNRSPKDGENLI